MKIALDTLAMIAEDTDSAVEALRRFAHIVEFRAVLDLGEDENNATVIVTVNERGNVEVEVPEA